MEELQPTVRLICSVAEILGTFLIAIEAMKLENFRALQDRFVRPFYRTVNPTMSTRFSLLRPFGRPQVAAGAAGTRKR